MHRHKLNFSPVITGERATNIAVNVYPSEDVTPDNLRTRLQLNFKNGPADFTLYPLPGEARALAAALLAAVETLDAQKPRACEYTRCPTAQGEPCPMAMSACPEYPAKPLQWPALASDQRVTRAFMSRRWGEL